MLLRFVIAISLVLVLVGTAIAQVELSVPPGPFKPEDRIQAKVTNNGRLPVRYCVEFGQWSPHDGTIESTPIPFYMEKLTREKWSVLINGPDVGSSRHAVELEPGSSQDFPFRLLDTGDMRLVMHYWVGSRDDVCSQTAQKRKTTRSKVFSITSR
jgi:hypothetical protein